MSIDRSKLLNVPHLGRGTKRQLSEVLSLLTRNFVRSGGEIQVCQPAFAVGCETPSNFRSLIRRDQRLSLG